MVNPCHIVERPVEWRVATGDDFQPSDLGFTGIGDCAM